MMGTEAQKLISLSLEKIATCRRRRREMSLHKNLLVTTVIHKARLAIIEESYYHMAFASPAESHVPRIMHQNHQHPNYHHHHHQQQQQLLDGQQLINLSPNAYGRTDGSYGTPSQPQPQSMMMMATYGASQQQQQPQSYSASIVSISGIGSGHLRSVDEEAMDWEESTTTAMMTSSDGNSTILDEEDDGDGEELDDDDDDDDEDEDDEQEDKENLSPKDSLTSQTALESRLAASSCRSSPRGVASTSCKRHRPGTALGGEGGGGGGGAIGAADDEFFNTAAKKNRWDSAAMMMIECSDIGSGGSCRDVDQQDDTSHALRLVSVLTASLGGGSSGAPLTSSAPQSTVRHVVINRSTVTNNNNTSPNITTSATPDQCSKQAKDSALERVVANRTVLAIAV